MARLVSHRRLTAVRAGYALWKLHEAVRPDGLVILIHGDRPSVSQDLALADAREGAARGSPPMEGLVPTRRRCSADTPVTGAGTNSGNPDRLNREIPKKFKHPPVTRARKGKATIGTCASASAWLSIP